MNLIEKYKTYKAEKKPIKIILNSTFDYKDHDLNVLKTCLNIWSNDDIQYKPLNFDWIFVNPDQKEKIFFISTNLKELKKFKLNHIIENPQYDILSNSYMDSYFTSLIFSEYNTMTTIKKPKEVKLKKSA